MSNFSLFYLLNKLFFKHTIVQKLIMTLDSLFKTKYLAKLFLYIFHKLFVIHTQKTPKMVKIVLFYDNHF